MDSAHVFLVAGNDRSDAKRKVEHFLRKNLLVRYTTLLFEDERTVNNLAEQFQQTIQWAIEQNKLTLQNLLTEFSDFGYEAISDLSRLPQGYESKLLHTITHLLDGFFGLDSFFYNLIEDSNWLSPSLEAKMEQSREAIYHLVHVQGSFASLDQADQIPHMRRLGLSAL